MPNLKLLTSARNSATPTKGGAGTDQTISDKLEQAETVEERYDVFADQLEGESEQFDADCERVGELLQRNDLRGLLKHGGRHTRERAEARAAAIRSRD